MLQRLRMTPASTRRIAPTAVRHPRARNGLPCLMNRQWCPASAGPRRS
jgi:hypothetical protein